MSKLKARRVARAAAGNSLYIDRKAMILKAAANTFLKKGFVATKLSDIAKEANMDRASLYYYVGSKQALFEEIFSGAVIDNIKDARAVEQEAIPCLKKLAKLMAMLMDSFERKYPFFYIFVQEDFKKIEHMEDPKNAKWLESSKAMSMEYFQIIRRIIAEGIENGEMKTRLPPNLVAHCLIGMMNSSSDWFHPNGIMSAKEIGEGMAKLLIDGLGNK